MNYDEHCRKCPYLNQKHLVEEEKTNRCSPPVELESHGSEVLLIFQSPGEEEWRVGLAIQPTKKIGGTAGSRIKQSWDRTGHNRSDFDIVNAVQCYPGKKQSEASNNRDAKPQKKAISACSQRLKHALQVGNYKRIITFGDIARDAIESICTHAALSGALIVVKHPSGGLKQCELDALW